MSRTYLGVTMLAAPAVDRHARAWTAARFVSPFLTDSFAHAFSKEYTMQHLSTLVAMVIGVAMSSAALAQDANEHSEHHVAQADAKTPALAEGEVRKVDKEAGKITLRHGPIDNLGMPPMTMVFRAKDLAMLDQVKAGDKVKFAAESVGGQMTVTQIERLP